MEILADHYEEVGLFKEAKKSHQEIISLCNQSVDTYGETVETIRMYLDTNLKLAKTEEKLGDFEQAVKIYKNVKDIFEKNLDLLSYHTGYSTPGYSASLALARLDKMY